jgi:hypothetical protein
LGTQLLVTAIGFALMIGMAALITWYRAMDDGKDGGALAGRQSARPLGSG